MQSPDLFFQLRCVRTQKNNPQRVGLFALFWIFSLPGDFFVSGERRNQDVLGQSVLETHTNIKRQRFRFGLHPSGSRTQRARAPPTPRPAAIKNPANTATDFVCVSVFIWSSMCGYVCEYLIYVFGWNCLRPHNPFVRFRGGGSVPIVF